MLIGPKPGVPVAPSYLAPFLFNLDSKNDARRQFSFY